jgi:hypothetical protein
MLYAEIFSSGKVYASALVAHMSKLIGALHVSTMEFFIIFETSHRRDASMIN